MRTCTIFCSSSRLTPESYLTFARALSGRLVERGWRVAYGGGRIGGMGAVASGALEARSAASNRERIVGVIPADMLRIGWGNPLVEDMRETVDMSERKREIIRMADAIVTLPGGTGTLDEFFEAYELRKLGSINVPIVLVNLDGFYDAVLEQLNRVVSDGLMTAEHVGVVSVCSTLEEVMAAITAPIEPRSLEEARV